MRQVTRVAGALGRWWWSGVRASTTTRLEAARTTLTTYPHDVTEGGERTDGGKEKETGKTDMKEANEGERKNTAETNDKITMESIEKYATKARAGISNDKNDGTDRAVQNKKINREGEAVAIKKPREEGGAGAGKRKGGTKKVTEEAVKPFSAMPGPRPWPLLGNRLLFTKLGRYPFAEWWGSAWRLHNDFGPVVRVAELARGLHAVVAFLPTHVRTLFQAEGKYPVRLGMDLLSYYRSQRPQRYSSPGLVPGNGPEWRRLRAGVQPLLRRQVVGAYRATQAQVAVDLVAALAARHPLQQATTQDSPQQPPQDHPQPGHLVPDLLPHLFHYTLEAVGVVSLGCRLGCLDPSPPALARQVIRANDEFLLVLGEAALSLPLPKPLLPASPAYRRLAVSQDTIGRVVESHLERLQEEAGADPDQFERRHPYLAALLLPPAPSAAPALPPADVLLLLSEVFQGGIDATATTLAFCVHFLARDAGVQELLFQEVGALDPSTHSLQGLSYLRAVVQETLRLRPSASASSRVIQQDVVMSGYHVPAGTFVICPPVVACHDPDVFPEPHAFRPERWLLKENQPQAKEASVEGRRRSGGVDPYTVVAFGHGARMCPGRRLAEQEIYLALIQLVKAYKIEGVRAAGQAAVGQVIRMNMMPDAPIAVRLVPRH